MIEFVLSGEVGDDGMAFSQGEGVLGVHNGRHFLHGVDGWVLLGKMLVY